MAGFIPHGLQGSLINAGAIVVFSFIGLLLHKGIPERVSQTVMDGFGLLLIVLGVQSGLDYQGTSGVITVIISLVLGAVLGELINIQGGMEWIGAKVETRFSSDGSPFGKAFVFTTLLYCTGAMAIMGPIEDGLNGDLKILLVKSLLDGISGLVFAATMGPGVLLSAVPVLLYQGSIGLAATTIKAFTTPEMLSNISSLGGILILGIGTNILRLTEIRIANLLPGLFLIPFVMWLIQRFFA
ncbi:MAG: DUF554 domain-containing protein [Solirubrobacterales bacterium]